MKSIRIALLLVAVVAVAFAGVADANCGKCGAGKHGACKAGAAGCAGYDKAAVKDFEAKIVSIDKEECKGCKMMHVDLVVMSKGEKVKVRLGPAWYLDNQGDVLKKDDVVKIYASMAKEGDEEIFVAGKIVKGDEVLMLRDKDGTPMWKGWRKSKA